MGVLLGEIDSSSLELGSSVKPQPREREVFLGDSEDDILVRMQHLERPLGAIIETSDHG